MSVSQMILLLQFIAVVSVLAFVVSLIFLIIHLRFKKRYQISVKQNMEISEELLNKSLMYYKYFSYSVKCLCMAVLIVIVMAVYLIAWFNVAYLDPWTIM